MRATTFMATVLAIAGATGGARAAEPVDFAHQIIPLIKKHCAECHTGEKRKGGLSMNSRDLLLKGGESGAAVVPGKPGESEAYLLVSETDLELRMPPKDKPALTPDEIALLKRWIEQGAAWEAGFAFGEEGYTPPLKPRRVELPPAVGGATNPVDRLLAKYYADHRITPPALVDDATFMRRVYLDVIGLLPPPDALTTFIADKSPDKRDKLVADLLARDRDYAEHWLTFWNDLLRNDYRGTGFIDGGRKQITPWLYAALLSNKPYDAFVRELVAPTAASEGFINGIKWRGAVNASQTREVQFSQNVSQVFLGINMKCASCHDSFIDGWKLDDAYALAAIVSDKPIEIHRCDKPTGQAAKARFIFPELGDIDASAPRAERLKQLAALLTTPDNGRTTRTVVNRIWHRLMGRGIVHPVDAMGQRPWSEDLLDYLAVHLAENGYDLKKTIELIATSRAYQAVGEVREAASGGDYVFTGPIARRMTAEQFMDAVWTLTGAGPTKVDAPIQRPPEAKVGRQGAPREVAVKPEAKWVWAYAGASESAPAGETVTLRRTFDLAAKPAAAAVVITCDNQYELRVNGKKVGGDDDWPSVERHEVGGLLRAGANEIVVIAKNLGGGPNPAALWMQMLTRTGEGDAAAWTTALVSDERWQVVANKTEKPAAVVTNQAFLGGEVAQSIGQAVGAVASGEPTGGDRELIRAALVNSDPLMRSLGRPNREQIVSTRPDDLSTLQALDLSNGAILADTLSRGARSLIDASGGDGDRLIRGLYVRALSREPTPAEVAIAKAVVGEPLSDDGVADLLWAIVMLPEFQLNR